MDIALGITKKRTGLIATKVILTIRRRIREISTDAGCTTTLAIAGSADAAVCAAAATIAGLAAGGSSYTRSATYITHGHAELGAQGWLGIHMRNNATATATATAAAAAAAGSRCRSTVHAASRK